ncbi:CesT family type III secretion system chaperone [Acanthopleuribacter pedis]|uniref:Type III secretion system chaperone n=1 Tax=Acanthopleuribacter pedis TaxID=442870 RepID=A0A8J7Q0E1_9BACT|nr:CesT family type III secretion system chaperone [Acanthopleuribacter pedis]MBO1318097.1 type III secretion system chaperone [Acanthopleuribacter pedis]
MQTTIETVNSWLSDIGTQIGTAIQLDENGLVTLSYSGDLDLSVEFNKLNEYLYFYATVGNAQGRDRTELFQDLLKRNLFSHETEGGAIGYDDQSDQVIYSKRFNPLSFESDSFIKTLEAFAMRAAKLKAQLNEGTGEASSEEATPSEIPAGGMMNPGFLKA